MTEPKNSTFQRASSLSGFTVIELLVVLVIMGIIMSVIVANIAGQRTNQKLRIAQNELVTNLRKIQSYALSSRNIQGNQSVQYYLMKIDLNNPRQYTIQAMYDVDSSPKLVDIETVQLPQGIRFALLEPIKITRPASVIPAEQKPSYPSGCALVAFRLPFAKIYFTDGCQRANWDPLTDDYKKILNFVVNTSNYPVSVDSTAVFTISDDEGKVSKTVTLYGVNGLVTFQ